jgi:hypothetical protein
MEQTTTPANARQVHFIVATIHFIKFLFPVLIAGLVFCHLTCEGGRR